MGKQDNKGLVYEALLECVPDEVPVTDAALKDWSRYVTQYLHDKGYAIKLRGH